LTLEINIDEDYKKQYVQGIKESIAWIEFYWNNTRGSYSEAKYAVKIPAEEVVVSGDTNWEGNLLENIQLCSQIRLPREGIWKIKAFFSAEEYDTIQNNLYFASLDGYAVDLVNYKNSRDVVSERYIHIDIKTQGTLCLNDTYTLT
jgi:hypothetical protein